MTLAEVLMALVITGITVAGIVNGYMYCMAATTKEGLYMAANGAALERMEQLRAARWDTSTYPPVDQLAATNFPNMVVTLDKTEANPIQGTIKTTITQISDTPPLRKIRVDCVWLFRGNEVVTNTIESCRAPNQ